MKHARKLVTLAIVLAMVMAFMVPTAFAADDGSIKITNATAGQTYKAYLIFTATPSDPDNVTSDIIYTATAAQVDVTGFDDIFDAVIDANGDYTVTKKSAVSDDAVITFVKANFDSLKQGSEITGTWTNNDTYTFSNLKYGYYYITSALGTVVTVDTAGKDISVVDKNASNPEAPDKDITAEDSSVNTALDRSSIEENSNDAAVGSVQSFQIDFNAVNWVKTTDDAQTAGSGTAGTKVTEYNFIDTPTGLAIDASTVKVTVNGVDITSTITDKEVNATTGVLTFTIPWVDASGNHIYTTQTAGSELIPVHVTYNATVTDAAATAAAPNTVEVKYNDTISLGTSTTTTYTYKFKVAKTDENSDPLEGAQFELYYADTTTGALKFTVIDGVYHYNTAGSVTRIAPTGTDATALIVGLDNANYVLKEVVVPAGYNKAADTSVTGVSRVDTADASVTTITIQNLKGTELPSTGGMGTTIFYILGSLMFIGAAVVLVTNKRMGREA